MKKRIKVAISVFFILLLVPLELVLRTLCMVRKILQVYDISNALQEVKLESLIYRDYEQELSETVKVVDAIFTSFGFILTGISSIINNTLFYIKEKKNCRRLIYNFLCK